MCSYTDPECPSKRRYAESAGDVAGTCVELGGGTCDPNAQVSETERALRDLPADTWSTIANSELEPFCLRQGLDDRCGDVIDNYGSVAYDSIGRRILTFGSHTYPGNEVYGFDLRTSSWTLVRQPSPIAQVIQHAETNADGTPNSRTTFDTLAFASISGELLSIGGYLYPFSDSNAISRATWRFDPATTTWTRGMDVPDSVREFSGIDYQGIAFDEATNRLYTRAMSVLAAYDVGSDTWLELRPITGPFVGSNVKAGIVVPQRRLFFTFGGRGMEDPSMPDAVVWDIEQARDVTLEWFPGTGDTSVLFEDGSGADYDPLADAIVAWIGGAPAVFDLETKVWTRTSANGAPMPSLPIYGSFFYVPHLNVFLLVNWAYEPIYAYKHLGGCGR